MINIRKDTLWKGIIEDLCDDFLGYFFPSLLPSIDFDKGFVFLDKELDSLYPEKGEQRFVDKLIKVWLNDGKEANFLVHIEVQGYQDRFFPERMFTYFYRIREKHRTDTTALVILTDENPSFHPQSYQYEFANTQLTYRFNSFKVLGKSEKELLVNGNIFSTVMLTAQKALAKKPSDQEVFTWKVDLIRSLFEAGHSAEKIRKVLHFIKFYVNFENPETVVLFENQVSAITKSRENMGIEEAILTQVREDGEKVGIEKGTHEKSVNVAKIALKEGLSPATISKLTGLSLEEIGQLAKNG